MFIRHQLRDGRPLTIRDALPPDSEALIAHANAVISETISPPEHQVSLRLPSNKSVKIFSSITTPTINCSSWRSLILRLWVC